MTEKTKTETFAVPDLVTPCCGASFFITTRYENRGEVPDEVHCNADGCLNSWDSTGKSDKYNRQPEPKGKK